MKKHYYPKVEEWCSDALGVWQVQKIYSNSYLLYEVTFDEYGNYNSVDPNNYRILNQWEIDRMNWE